MDIEAAGERAERPHPTTVASPAVWRISLADELASLAGMTPTGTRSQERLEFRLGTDDGACIQP